MSEKEHSRLAPSSMSRILKCGGSAIPDPPDNSTEYSIEGDLAHDCSERLLKGEDVDFNGNTEMEQGCWKFVDYVRAHLEQEPDSELIVEQRMVSDVCPDHGGTADALIISPTHIHIIDFKYGMKAVKAKENKQGLSYLSLANEKYPGRTKFQFSIVQPRVFEKPHCAEFSLAEIEAHALEVLLIADDDSRHAGDHCVDYCPLFKQCAVRDEWVSKTVEDVLLHKAFGEEMTVEQCLNVLQLKPVINKLEREAMERMTYILNHGGEIPGWRLGQSLGNREWIDEDAVILELQLKDVPEEVYMDKRLKSPSQLEAFSKAYKKVTAEHTQRILKGVIAVEEGSSLPEPEDIADFFKDLT